MILTEALTRPPHDPALLPCRYVQLGRRCETQELRAAQRLCRHLGLELSMLNAEMLGTELRWTQVGARWACCGAVVVSGAVDAQHRDAGDRAALGLHSCCACCGFMIWFGGKVLGTELRWAQVRARWACSVVVVGSQGGIPALCMRNSPAFLACKAVRLDVAASIAQLGKPLLFPTTIAPRLHPPANPQKKDRRRIIPHRNLVLLSLAASHAVGVSDGAATHLAMCTTQDDLNTYSTSSSSFLQHMDALLAVCWAVLLCKEGWGV